MAANNAHLHLPLRNAESQVTRISQQTIHLPHMETIDALVPSPAMPWSTTRPGMTDFTYLISVFIIKQVQLHLQPTWRRGEIAILGDAAIYDIAIIQSSEHPNLPPLDNPIARYQYLYNSISIMDEYKERRGRGQTAPAPTVVHGVVKRCVSQFGHRVYTDLTAEEMQADFVVWRVMHPIGAMETQFVPMEMYKRVRATNCTCMGNPTILMSWPDIGDWKRSSKHKRTLIEGGSINELGNDSIILRGDPCCWSHWTTGEGYSRPDALKMSEMPRWVITRRPWIEFAGEIPPLDNGYRGDRFVSMICQDRAYSVTKSQTEETLKTWKMMVLPVPMHKFEPTTEQPIIHYVQPPELNNVLRDLIIKEQETEEEQILIVRLHKQANGEWQPALSWYKPMEELLEGMVPRPVLEIGEAEPVISQAANASSASGSEERQNRARESWR